jgi:DNA polymerase III alpha subunit
MEGGFLEMFMRRHLHQEPVTYPHPNMEPILSPTYGVILYQEQFLQLANALAGLGLGEAEKLRKDLGKARSPEERNALGSWFVAGAIERGIDQMQAEKVWEVMAGYSGFGFCKAHACSYALTAYRSAYMKAHYPAHYMAAQINNMGGYYGPSVYVEDARRQGVEILPPHINRSGALCEVPLRSRSIRIGLQFVKGLSERGIAALLHERRNNGPFTSLPDLMARVDLSPKELAALVKVGALDNISEPDVRDVSGEEGRPENTAADAPASEASEGVGIAEDPDHEQEDESLQTQGSLNRRQLVWLLPALLSMRKSRARGAIHRMQAQSPGALHLPTGTDGLAVQMLMGDVWGHVSASAPRVLGGSAFGLEAPEMDDYSPSEKLRMEQEAMGFAATCNEMEFHRDVVEAQGVVPQRRLVQHAGREVKVAGVVAAGRRHMTKEGEWMIFITLQDLEGLIEVVLFPEAYKDNAEVLANSGYGPYIVQGTVQVAGKGRGIGVQLPADLRPTDAVTMKMHPVIIAREFRPL